MRSARGSLTDAAGSLTDAVLSPLRRSRRESAGPDEAAVSLRQSEDNALLSYLETHRGACLQSGWVELENPAAGRLDRKYKRRWFEIHPHALVWYKLHAPELPKGYLLLSSTHALDETSGRGAAISVTGTAGVLVRFRASSPEEHFLWIETLTTALRAAAAAAAEDSLAEQSRLEKWPSLMEPSPAQPRPLSDVPSELFAERERRHQPVVRRRRLRRRQRGGGRGRRRTAAAAGATGTAARRSAAAAAVCAASAPAATLPPLPEAAPPRRCRGGRRRRRDGRRRSENGFERTGSAARTRRSAHAAPCTGEQRRHFEEQQKQQRLQGGRTAVARLGVAGGAAARRCDARVSRSSGARAVWPRSLRRQRAGSRRQHPRPPGGAQPTAAKARRAINAVVSAFRARRTSPSR